ncbi:MAG TPA: exodeoxyribonuclease VII small subunit [Candidatus Avacidaminococcus intestinavium]|uniref:Exodeoxyribonuclease 7 small subunit n=1 Tax=Candidatus Avacidaminococcus intestinavium TaxID=2840684 RepID=A0A9D1SLD4_9FIRM|nr:exodeoxyribonuclease VII small subunit [Candidatus Avacidaminococcus intestinavium]
MKNIKFEEALALLEENVKKLESGTLPLEESLDVFKEGVELSKVCFTKLNSVKQEVQKIVPQNDGEFVLTSFGVED